MSRKILAANYSVQREKYPAIIKLYLLLAQDPVVSLSLCDRLKPVLGSGWSFRLDPRDCGREVRPTD